MVICYMSLTEWLTFFLRTCKIFSEAFASRLSKVTAAYGKPIDRSE